MTGGRRTASAWTTPRSACASTWCLVRRRARDVALGRCGVSSPRTGVRRLPRGVRAQPRAVVLCCRGVLIIEARRAAPCAARARLPVPAWPSARSRWLLVRSACAATRVGKNSLSRDQTVTRQSACRACDRRSRRRTWRCAASIDLSTGRDDGNARWLRENGSIARISLSPEGRSPPQRGPNGESRGRTVARCTRCRDQRARSGYLRAQLRVRAG